MHPLVAAHYLFLPNSPDTPALLSGTRYERPSFVVTELSSDALGGHVIDVSDEFFCPASNLLKVPVRSALSRSSANPSSACPRAHFDSRRYSPLLA